MAVSEKIARRFSFITVALDVRKNGDVARWRGIFSGSGAYGTFSPLIGRVGLSRLGYVEPFFFPNTVALDVREESRWAPLFFFSLELFLRWLRFTDRWRATALDGLDPFWRSVFYALGIGSPVAANRAARGVSSNPREKEREKGATGQEALQGVYPSLLRG